MITTMRTRCIVPPGGEKRGGRIAWGMTRKRKTNGAARDVPQEKPGGDYSGTSSVSELDQAGSG